MSVRRGAIADDFTGATDLAGNWRARGLRTTVHLGVPDPDDTAWVDDVDAVVVALKSRSIDPGAAVEQARAAAGFLHRVGCEQLYDKYCSTFDSTPAGNIGPVADMLLELTGAGHAVVVPSFPDNHRTVYQGHLFVGTQPLDESPLKDHPLNPMWDSSVVRLLEAQSGNRVGLVPLQVVHHGVEAVRAALAAQERSGARLVVVDAVDNTDLQVIAAATADSPLVTGGSGLALGLEPQERAARPLTAVPGHRVVLSGSASTATQAQVRHARDHMPHQHLRLEQLVQDPAVEVRRLVAWVRERWAAQPDQPVLIYSVADPEHVAAGRRVTESASQLVENAFSELAVALSRAGASQLLVAGGETSGSVLEGLRVTRLEVGTLISPGVSWLAGASADGTEHNFVLKSGNFGAEDLFSTAWTELS